MPVALLALTAGAFGIGVTEFVLMGLLLETSADLHVTVAQAGLLISGYAFGVVLGAPVLTTLTARWPRKAVLLGLMVIFTLGNAACALAHNYALLMTARVLTAFAHGTFFGVGSVVATGLVPPNRRASAIAIMFTGLTVACFLGFTIATRHYIQVTDDDFRKASGIKGGAATKQKNPCFYRELRGPATLHKRSGGRGGNRTRTGITPTGF